MLERNSVAVRLQQLPGPAKTLVVAHLVENRSDNGMFTTAQVAELLEQLAIPPLANLSNVLSRLQDKDYVTRNRAHQWRFTPLGRVAVQQVFRPDEIAQLYAETFSLGFSIVGDIRHPLIPPELAPPEIWSNLRGFLTRHSFETNVFMISRFPKDQEDPLDRAHEVARQTLSEEGLTLHVASDGAISDDLWSNVAAYMWASKYGLAIIEDRVGSGVNHNAAIEVGAMLMTGRRCALLKDRSVSKMPTDLIGRIYRPIDLDDSDTVMKAIADWVTDDLRVRTMAD